MVRQLDATYQRADWRLLEQLYRQVSSILNDVEKKNQPSDQLLGFLAQALGRVSAHYDGDELLFTEDLLALWRHIDGLQGDHKASFLSLYLDERFERIPGYRRGADGRRKPKLFEAAIETERRLRDVNGVRDAMADQDTAAILGGSSSYGRFLSVRGATYGAEDSSDVDLLLVVNEAESVTDVADALARVDGVSESSIALMKERSEHFLKLNSAYNEPCVFSQKVTMWRDDKDPSLREYGIGGDYRLSCHVLTRDAFEYLILTDRPVLSASELGYYTRDMWDYRDSEPGHGDDVQRSFSGIDVTLARDYSAVEDGYISKIRACYIANDRYFPGLFQNMILPQFEIRWDFRRRPLFLQVSGFRWKIVERLREERRQRPFELHRLSQSHTRAAEFAPHVVRAVDSGYQMVL